MKRGVKWLQCVGKVVTGSGWGPFGGKWTGTGR